MNVKGGDITSDLWEAMDAMPDMIVANLLAVDEHSFTVGFDGEAPLPGVYYSIDGIGLNFLAGKLVWTRSGRAGLFFKHPIHKSMLERIRPSSDGKVRICLKPVPD